MTFEYSPGIDLYRHNKKNPALSRLPAIKNQVQFKNGQYEVGTEWGLANYLLSFDAWLLPLQDPLKFPLQKVTFETISAIIAKAPGEHPDPK